MRAIVPVSTPAINDRGGSHMTTGVSSKALFTASSLIAKDVLDYCMFDDVAYTTEDGVPHAFGLNNNTLEKIDSDPHPNKGDPAYMFWVRRDQGPLGRWRQGQSLGEQCARDSRRRSG